MKNALFLFILVYTPLHLRAQYKMTGFPGIEISPNFDLQRRDYFNFGANYLWTHGYFANSKNHEFELFGLYMGTFQFGPSLTFNTLKISDNRIWRANATMTYNQITDAGLGISLRGGLNTVFDGDKNLLNNMGFKREIGLTYYGYLTLYYGYNSPIRDYTPYTFRERSITLTLNLNPSFIMYVFDGYGTDSRPTRTEW
jgi:hypothetical protein